MQGETHSDASERGSPLAAGPAWWLQEGVSDGDGTDGSARASPRRRRASQSVYFQRMRSTIAAVSALSAPLRPFGEAQWWRVRDLLALEAAHEGESEDCVAEEVSVAIACGRGMIAAILQSCRAQIGKELCHYAASLRDAFACGGEGREEHPTTLPVDRFWRLAKWLELDSPRLPLDRIQPLVRLACSRGRERDALLALGAAAAPGDEWGSPPQSPGASSPRGRRARPRRSRSIHAGAAVRQRVIRGEDCSLNHAHTHSLTHRTPSSQARSTEEEGKERAALEAEAGTDRGRPLDAGDFVEVIVRVAAVRAPREGRPLRERLHQLLEHVAAQAARTVANAHRQELAQPQCAVRVPLICPCDRPAHTRLPCHVVLCSRCCVKPRPRWSRCLPSMRRWTGPRLQWVVWTQLTTRSGWRSSRCVTASTHPVQP